VIKIILTIFGVSLAMISISRAKTSELWGQAGELWLENQPLRDFSHAGYRQSEVPIPDTATVVNIRNFGGRGDDKADDTQALLKTIAACPAGGKKKLPAGDYVINDLVEIKKSSIVIAGEGRDRTKLIFPKFLAELHPRRGVTTTGNPTSLWSWSGGFIEFNDSHDVGMEDLTFQFPDIPYAGHFKERGSNGINFSKVHDGWARRLRLVNADSGIFVTQSRNVTLREIEFDACKDRSVLNQKGMAGHHALDFVASTFCLADEIQFKVKFFHELGIEHGANGNVYSRCTGPDLVFDHHEPDVYGNLWTDIDAGQGIRIWLNNCRGSTMNEVYWNIRAAKNIPYPDSKLKNIVIGMTGIGTESRNPAGPWVEVISPADLKPKNIFQAELEKRIGAEKARVILEN
jgi:Pectate lyase superfamily protein